MKGGVVLHPEVEREGEYQRLLGSTYDLDPVLSSCGSKSLLVVLDVVITVRKAVSSLDADPVL